ncbi:MAG: hypothetical protein JSW39_07735 [Desulfobacterales bacterium]|nr:MAG: hypothetical protein JSW39_07735 [Desulfobacterales bacterium]
MIYLRQKTKILLLITALQVLLLSLYGCVQQKTTASCIKAGQSYGVTQGLFQGRWYHFYERGLSFADGHCWEEAASDFKEALKQRDDGDRRRARTYGMHFVDYFPHRELGITFFHQKRYTDAIRELEASLSATVTAKAEFYLDQARKALILSQAGDQRPPEIVVQNPAPGFETNQMALRVSGRVRDDNFVKSVRINDRSIRIDLARPEVQFETEVPLRPGDNIITISATDLVDNKFQVQRKVKVDRQGPVISIDEPAEGAILSGPKVRVKGFIHDETNLARVQINGHEILERQAPEFTLDYLMALTPPADRITIEAVDLLGNQTQAQVRLSPKTSGLPAILFAALDLPLLARNLTDPGQAGVKTVPLDTQPPVVQLNDWTEEQTVFLAEAYLEGFASDDERVEDLIVNGDSILRRPGKKVFFNDLVRLEEGRNLFHIEAKDHSGNQGSKSIGIERKRSKIREVGARMDLVMLPFERKGEPAKRGRLVEETLLSALLESGRFNVKSKLALASANLDDPATAASIGKSLGVNYVLAGSILTTATATEIYAQIVETQTSEVVTINDVYGENVDHEVFKKLCKGLTIRLQDALPLAEGLVIKVSGKRVLFDLGRANGIKKGMRLILYQEGEPIVHPVTQKILGVEVDELGKALVTAVYDEFGEAEIQEGRPDQIAPSQKIITQ